MLHVYRIATLGALLFSAGCVDADDSADPRDTGEDVLRGALSTTLFFDSPPFRPYFAF